jgi:hypothetical protein
MRLNLVTDSPGPAAICGTRYLRTHDHSDSNRIQEQSVRFTFIHSPRDLENTWMTAARQLSRKHTDNICESIRMADTITDPRSFCLHPVTAILYRCIFHPMLISILPDCDLWESYLPLVRIRKVPERVPLGFVKRRCGERKADVVARSDVP